MKRLIIAVITLTLMVVLASCGQSASGSTEAPQNSSGFFKSDKTIDGEWHTYTEEDYEDYDEVLTIDGDSALLELLFGEPCKGKVNRADSSITFEHEGGTFTLEYEVIGNKLVLTGDKFETLSFMRKDEQ